MTTGVLGGAYVLPLGRPFETYTIMLPMVLPLPRTSISFGTGPECFLAQTGSASIASGRRAGGFPSKVTVPVTVDAANAIPGQTEIATNTAAARNSFALPRIARLLISRYRLWQQWVSAHVILESRPRPSWSGPTLHRGYRPCNPPEHPFDPRLRTIEPVEAIAKRSEHDLHPCEELRVGGRLWSVDPEIVDGQLGAVAAGVIVHAPQPRGRLVRADVDVRPLGGVLTHGLQQSTEDERTRHHVPAMARDDRRAGRVLFEPRAQPLRVHAQDAALEMLVQPGAAVSAREEVVGRRRFPRRVEAELLRHGQPGIPRPEGIGAHVETPAGRHTPR